MTVDPLGAPPTEEPDPATIDAEQAEEQARTVMAAWSVERREIEFAEESAEARHEALLWAI